MRGLLIVVVLSACGTLTQAPPSADVTPTDDAGASTPGAEAGTSDGGRTGPCSSREGPSMVSVGGQLCIDSTEVTNAHYRHFLDATDKPAQPSACQTNVNHVPKQAWPPQPGNETRPVAYVNWCDAWVYCKWAGKRLCGFHAGVDEWTAACAPPNARFPYGDSYDGSKCVTGLTNGGATRPVGTPTCEGGVRGLFDMSGNVYEWVDICDGDAGPADECGRRGGGYTDDGAQVSCTHASTEPRNAAYSDTGIRCCSTP